MGIVLTAVLPALLQLLEEAPTLIADGEAVVAEVRQAWALLSSQAAPTADQQAQIDAALDKAHAALQAA